MMKKVIILLLVIFSYNSLYAQLADSLVKQGNAAYVDDRFDDAIAIYDSVLSMKFESADLFYNIGNAYYKSGDYARARLNFERSLLLDPKNEDAKHNLAKSQTYLIDKIEEIPEFFFARWLHGMVRSMPANMWALISMVTFTLGLALLLLYFLSNKLVIKKSGFYLGVIILFFSALSFYTSYKAKQFLTENDSAIVLTPTVTVKGSPEVDGTNVFIIHEGAKVFITDEVSGWYEIKLSDGKQGWLLEGDVERI